MGATKGGTRRKHSDEFRAAVLAECRQPGASIAGVALHRQLNANMLRAWPLLDQFDAGGLQKLAVGGMSDGFLLNSEVDNDLTELFLGNQVEGHGYVYRAGQEFFDAFFAQQFAELDQLGRVAGPTVYKVLVAKKYCQVGVSPQRWMTSSSLSLKACLRYSKATIRRVGRHGRPALEVPPPATAVTGPTRSRPSIFLPALTCRAQRGAREVSISCHGKRLASTASGWRKSIIWSRRLRKKSSVMALLSKTPRKQALLNIYLRVLTIRIHAKPQAFMRVSGVYQGRPITVKFQICKSKIHR
jgi:hypothetical protein